MNSDFLFPIRRLWVKQCGCRTIADCRLRILDLGIKELVDERIGYLVEVVQTVEIAKLAPTE
jgi:hypothetical protein